MKYKISFEFKDFDKRYKELLTFAILRMEDVVEHPVFLEILKDEISKSNKLEGELSKWKNATPEAIYEQLRPISLSLNTYYTSDNVIGYGYEGNREIYLNKKYLMNYKVDNANDLMMVGSNLLHEHGHDCGFDHDFKVTDRRRNSICYLLNRVYERSYKKIYNLQGAGYVAPSKFYPVPWYKKLWRAIWK